MQFTEPDVFILESLAFQDEVAGRYEGKVLADLLRLAGKKPAYYYFRTERELHELAQLYRLSNYRFLHLSCHGTPDVIYTTLGQIPVIRFATIFQNRLKLRRLFVSACQIGSGFLAEHVRAKNKGMHSIASPVDSITFDRAVAIWAAFYVRMFDLDPNAMTSKNIADLLTNLCRLFGVRFSWSWYSPSTDSWKVEELGGAANQLPASVRPRPAAPAISPAASVPPPPAALSPPDA